MLVTTRVTNIINMEKKCGLKIGIYLGTLCVFRSNHPEVFLRKVALKICSKFTGEHTCRSVISINLLCNFTEITLRHWCSPVNLLHIFRTAFPKNTSEGLLLCIFFHICYARGSSGNLSFPWLLDYQQMQSYKGMLLEGMLY